MSDVETVGIAQALQDVLARVADRSYAARLEKVYTAADACMGGLRSIDLSVFEREEETGPDLQLWEQVAPAVGQTLAHVSTLIQAIQGGFPETAPSDEPSDGIDIDLDVDLLEKGKVDESAFAVRAAGKVLAQQVAALGMGVRNPEVVADRWGLLNLLQASIGRFYSAIADMVVASAVPFGDVRRADVVPYHGEMLKDALTVRRAAADLSRVIGLYVDKLKGSVLSEMPPLLGQLERDLASFSKTAAYKTLWASDKQKLLGYRARLRDVAANSTDAEVIRGAMDEFAGFITGLSKINERILLKDHDREVAASCAVKLEQAELARTEQPEEAALMVADVLREAWSLYGRDAELDAYLRKVKKRGSVTLDVDSLRDEIDQATRLISRVPLALYALESSS